MTDSALASTLIGYQVGVTPLQMVSAVSAVANGGELIQPRIVRAVVKDGVRLPVPRKVLGRAISKDTAARLTPMLEGVVTDGTGKQAAIDDYTIAGKTGTAKKLVNGSYKGHSNYNVSFVGFAPSRKPKFTIIVVVDSPHGVPAYGGTVAAPIFQRIAEQALRHYGVQRTDQRAAAAHRRAPAARRADAGVGARRAAERAAGGRYRDDGSGRAGSDRDERPRRGADARDARPAGADRRARPRHRSAPAARDAGRGGGVGARVARSTDVRGGAESARSMTVRDVLRSVAALVPAEARSALDAPGLDTPCTGVVYDSRAVTPGSVFVALQGLRADGAAFVPQAVAAGAAAVVAAAGVAPAAGAVVAAGRRSAPGARAAGRRVQRPSEPLHARRRRHRHERQDDHGLSGARHPRGRRDQVRADGDGGRTASATARSRRRAPRRKRPTCRASSARWSTRRAAPA